MIERIYRVTNNMFTMQRTHAGQLTTRRSENGSMEVRPRTPQLTAAARQQQRGCLPPHVATLNQHMPRRRPGTAPAATLHPFGRSAGAWAGQSRRAVPSLSPRLGVWAAAAPANPFAQPAETLGGVSGQRALLSPRWQGAWHDSQ